MLTFTTKYWLLLGLLIYLLFSSPASAQTLTVNAHGTPTRSCTLILFCTDTYPRISVYVNGTQYGGNQYVNGSPQDYYFNVTLPSSGTVNIDVMFDNNISYPHVLQNIFGDSGDRNVYYHTISIGSKSFTPTDAGVYIDRGDNYSLATDGIDTLSYGNAMYWDGTLRMSTTVAEINPPSSGTATKIAEYRMNESGWNGTNNELKDTAGYAGGPYHGEALDDWDSEDPSSLSSNRARPGSPGTCRYARINEHFNDVSAFQIDNLPVDVSSGAQTSVSFWMYWDGRQYVMPMGWRYYNLYIANGHFGFNTAQSDIYGISSSGLANGWHHVVAVFTNNNIYNNQLYIDGVAQSLSQRMGSPSNSYAEVKTTLQISGWTANDNYRFEDGYLDEFKVFNGAVSQAQVDEIYNETYQCAGETVDLLPTVENLAPSATVTTSYVSPWENLEAVNDEVTATTSYVYHLADPAGIKTYGNWNGSTTGATHWVSFEWPTAKQLTEFQVFWWDDSFQGANYVIYQPTNANVEYWDGSAWQSLGSIGTSLHTFNSLTINNISTTRIRVSMQSSKATGITEVRIFGYEPATLVAEHHFDEDSWDGSANEVIDTAGYSGGPYHGSAIGSTLPNANFIDPAIAGTNSGTCGYAELSGPTSGGGAFTFNNLPIDTSNGAKNSISFWIYWDGTDQVIPMSSNDYGILISGNNIGFTSDGTDLYGTNASSLVNGWHHIAAVFNQGDVQQNKLYIDGSLQTLSQLIGGGSARVVRASFDAEDYATGFITPLSPWTTDNSGGTVEIGYNTWFNVTGSTRRVMELEQHNGDVSNIKATISTNVGDTVYVSFDHAESQDSGYYTSDFYLYIDNQQIDRVDRDSMSFAHYEYSGVTNSTSTVVELRGTSTNSIGVILDDIVIETEGTNASLNTSAQFGGLTSNTSMRFTGRIDELKVYRGEIIQSQVTADYNATHSCPSYVVNVAAHDFNCIAEQETSVDTGHLYMQVAGQPFNLKVVALKSDGTVETAISAASDKTVILEFLDQTQASLPITFSDGSNIASKVLTFATTNTTGIVTVNNITINHAYRNLRCRVTDASQLPTLTATSYDNFSVRPLEFTLTSNANADSTGTNPNATPTLVAGDTFTINANTNTPGYNYAPQFDNSKRNAHAGAPRKGSLTGSFINANSSTGNAIGSNFVYDEVGYVKINTQGVYDSTFTAVDSGNGDCLDNFSNVASGGKYGCKFRNNTQSDFFGRFIPYHFDVGGGSRVTTGECSSNFTYYGQDGLSTEFQIRAENLSGALLRNYDGAFAKLDVGTWTDTSATTGLRFSATNLPAGVTLSPSATPITGSWNEGLATVVAKHQLSRPSTPVGEVNLAMEMDAIDSDGVGVDDGTPESINHSSNALFRYGRLSLSNAHGSELLPLFIPIEAQYWDGVTYRKNTLDNCSTMQAANVSMSDYQRNLAACETSLSSSSTMNAGEITLQLTAPGSGNSGSVTLTPNLSTPVGNTCAPTSTAATASISSWFGSASLSIKATFGLHKTPVIYMHESF